jgi:hypothetical protein
MIDEKNVHHNSDTFSIVQRSTEKMVLTATRGCQMVYLCMFEPKNLNLGKFWRASELKMLVYFMAICNILQPFGWPFGNVVVIWYIFPRFGILCQEKSGNPAAMSSVSGYSRRFNYWESVNCMWATKQVPWSRMEIGNFLFIVSHTYMNAYVVRKDWLRKEWIDAVPWGRGLVVASTPATEETGTIGREIESRKKEKKNRCGR